MSFTEKALKYSKFILPEYFIITILSVVAFSLILVGTFTITEIIRPILVVSLTMIGLNSVNNLSDVDIDRINKPERPLVTGKMKRKNAARLGVAAFIVGLLIAASINLVAAMLATVAIIAAVTYSVKPFRFKRVLLGPNIIGAFIYAIFPYLLVWNEVGGELSIIFILFFGGLIFSMAPIKDIEDLKGIKRFGIKSIASLIGVKKTMGLVICLLFFLNLAMLVLELMGAIGLKFAYATIISFLLIFSLACYYLTTLRKIYNERVVTQSIVVTATMITIVLIELIYGLTNIFF